MPMPRFLASLLFAIAGVMLAGCRHTAVASTSLDEGTSSYRFVDPTLPPTKKGGLGVSEKLPTEQVINAQPIMPLATPIYPPTALAAHAGLATIGVRITVDAAGRVADVRPSLASVTVPSSFGTEFRAAVDAAVAQWRFRPAEIRHLELVKDVGGDFQRVTAREKTEWAFDVEFAFTAMGDVLTRLPK